MQKVVRHFKNIYFITTYIFAFVETNFIQSEKN